MASQLTRSTASALPTSAQLLPCNRVGNADRWSLADDALAATLDTSIEAWARTLDAPPADRAVVEYLDRLRAEDLLLACACRIGIADAWEHFIAHYRGMLTAAARALVREESR